jgi:hypothetical protein
MGGFHSHAKKKTVSLRMSHPIGEAERRNQNPAGTMTFEQFFTTATGGNQSYDYQRRLAGDSACQSRLIETPFRFGNR